MTAQLTPANVQIDPLVEAGFRVIAPDLRGAVGGESDAPMEVEAYDIQKVIINDITGKTLVSWWCLRSSVCSTTVQGAAHTSPICL